MGLWEGTPGGDGDGERVQGVPPGMEQGCVRGGVRGVGPIPGGSGGAQRVQELPPGWDGVPGCGWGALVFSAWGGAQGVLGSLR